MENLTKQWYFWVAVGVALVVAWEYFKKDEKHSMSTTTGTATTTAIK